MCANIRDHSDAAKPSQQAGLRGSAFGADDRHQEVERETPVRIATIKATIKESGLKTAPKTFKGTLLDVSPRNVTAA